MTTPRRLNLALQGGGAHGAFTWGVLDRLLEVPGLSLEGVTGTSAGAMNGAMLTTGLKTNGPAEAKERLAQFWGKIADSFPLNKPPWSFWSHAFPPAGGSFEPPLSPAFLAGDALARLVSPYQFNPAGTNPLRGVLEDLVDFEKVCRSEEPRLFVCATDAQSGRAKIFQGDEISIDALLASACLPTLYQAVEIEGRSYWDGGYTGNPPLWPLVYHCDCQDILIVHVNPIERDATPKDARGIEDRISEISFNSNLLNELRAIDTVGRLVAEGALPPNRYKRMRIHAVSAPEVMAEYSAASKLQPSDRLLEELRAAGREAMDRWVSTHLTQVGVDSSVDIRSAYL